MAYNPEGITSSGSLLVNNPAGGIGYSEGARGTAVTQITDRTTGVTIDGLCGKITTINTSLAAEASAVFTVTNSSVAIGDVVILSQRSGKVGLNTDCVVTAVANGSFNITVINGNAAGGTAETGAIVLNFAVIKTGLA